MEPLEGLKEGKIHGLSPEELHKIDESFEKAEDKNNPWAVCTAALGTQEGEKFESCVLQLKRRFGAKSAKKEVTIKMPKKKKEEELEAESEAETKKDAEEEAGLKKKPITEEEGKLIKESENEDEDEDDFDDSDLDEEEKAAWSKIKPKLKRKLHKEEESEEGVVKDQFGGKDPQEGSGAGVRPEGDVNVPSPAQHMAFPAGTQTGAGIGSVPVQPMSPNLKSVNFKDSPLSKQLNSMEKSVFERLDKIEKSFNEKVALLEKANKVIEDMLNTPLRKSADMMTAAENKEEVAVQYRY